jgi:Condensation domain
VSTPVAHPALLAPERLVVPVSENQRARLLERIDAERRGQEPPPGNVIAAYWLQGRLEEDLLESVLEHLPARHCALRASFRITGNAVRQTIEDEASLRLQRLGALTDTAAMNSARRFAERPFELDEVPRIRAALARVNPRRALLVLAADHCVADGWSLAILLEELWSGYEGGLAGSPPLLEPEATDYVEAMRGEARWLSSAEAMAIFREVAAEQPERPLFPPLRLPGPKASPALPGGEAGTVERRLDSDGVAAAQELAKRLRCPLFVVVATSLARTIRELCGEEQPGFATVLANRDRIEVAETVGYFANRGFLHSDLRRHRSFDEAAERVRAALSTALRRQRYPYMELVRRLAPEQYRGAAQPYLVLNYLDRVTMSVKEGGGAGRLRWSWVSLERVGPSPGVIALVEQDDEGWSFGYRYDRKAYSRQAVEALADGWLGELEAASR